MRIKKESNPTEKIPKQMYPERLETKKKVPHGGRPRKLNAEKATLAKKLYANSENTVTDICRTLGVSRPTFYAYLYDRHLKS